MEEDSGQEEQMIITSRASAQQEEQKDGAHEQPIEQNNAEEAEYVATEPWTGGFFDPKDGSASVKVAVRVRPMVSRELRSGASKSCVETEPGKLRMGGKEFAFDSVFDMDSCQDDLFHMCSYNQVLGLFEGYNATILAYGQTGSGKTHSMGTGSTIGMPKDQIGIVPRVFDFIFQELDNRRKASAFSKFTVKVQFLELYQEDLHDLLDMQIDKNTGLSTKQLAIREERDGSISIQGLKAEEVETTKQCLDFLNKGIGHRVTAGTNMNENSSRSHAIFTITIEQKIVKVMEGGEKDENGDPVTSEENISAKFHFVDLAGSERIKKTGAEGKVLREGININKGLLILGNVISALTDQKKIDSGKAHIPYRDSKLTRILQDSLGGNSKTTMLACVSPAEQNHEETLGTIKYASRARNIKNKPVVNRDANSMLIEALRNQITSLQAEVGEYQGILKSNAIPIPEDMNSRIESISGQKKEQISSSSAPASSSLVLPGAGQQQSSAQASSSMQELRELKLKYARVAKELKTAQEQIAQMGTKGSESKSGLESLQNERDQLVLSNEALNELLKKNNIEQPKDGPAATSATAGAGGKRTTTLIDEYKIKLGKFQADVEARTKELLQKSKKITELQSQIKRDETVLKKYSSENAKLKMEAKRGMTNQSASPATQAVPARKRKDADTADIGAKLMDKLTSQIQGIFAGDEDSEDESGGSPAKREGEGGEEDEHEHEQEQESEQQNLQNVREAQKALQTPEGNEQIMKAVKEKYMLIQKDLEDVIQNKWEQKIIELQSQKAHIEKERIQQIKQEMDGARAKELEKKYKAQMDDLNKKLAKEELDKKKKEGALAKAMQQQEARIKVLETEVEKQKKRSEDEMYRRKYGEERFAKYQTKASTDIQQTKKTVQEKSQTVSKLTGELKKSDQKVQQKIAELRGLQKKAREEREQRAKEEEREHESKGIDVDVIKDWINLNTDQMIKNKELTEYLHEQEKAKDDLEDEMLELGDRLGELMLSQDRLSAEQEEMREREEDGEEVDEVRMLEIEGEIEDVEMEQASITETLDSLQEHMDFVLDKINEIRSEINAYDIDNVNPPRFKGLKNVDVAKATLQTFFLVMLDLNVYKKELEGKCIEQDEEILKMRTTLSVLKEENPAAMTYAEKQAQLRKERQMNKVISQLGDGVDYMDNRDAENITMTAEEQSALTKMSLSKIVSNLRSKLKDEGKKNEKLNHKMDQLIKEKEQLKQKLKEQDMAQKRGGSGPIKFTMASLVSASAVSPNRAATSSTQSPESRPVRSRIDTGRANVTTTQPSKPKPPEKSPEKRLSFKDRRNMMKANQSTANKQKPTASAAMTKSKPQTPGQKTGNQNSALQQKRDQLKQEKQQQNVTYQTEAALIAGVQSTQPPEMIVEDEDEEEEEEKRRESARVNAELAEEEKLKLLENVLDLEMSMVTNATEDIDGAETDLGDEHSWKLVPLLDLQMKPGVKLCDIDQVDDRVFVLYDDMTLVEISIKSKSIIRQSLLGQIADAQELQDQQASAFSVFKELDMFAVVVSEKVALFDYAGGEPSFVKTLDVANVTYVTFVECQIILCIEPEDSDDIKLSCYEIEDENPQSEITIKRFMDNKIMLRPGYNAVYFSAGKQIGRISVPEMELEYQQDSGHVKEILDFYVTDTTIYTTSADEELRVFDCESGMQVIAPLEEMGCDKLAANGQYLLARCGGDVMLIFRYIEGEEDLEEVDMIELKENPEEEYTATDFKMRVGGHKATLGDEKEYQIVFLAEQKEAGLAIKLLTHAAH